MSPKTLTILGDIKQRIWIGSSWIINSICSKLLVQDGFEEPTPKNWYIEVGRAHLKTVGSWDCPGIWIWLERAEKYTF